MIRLRYFQEQLRGCFSLTTRGVPTIYYLVLPGLQLCLQQYKIKHIRNFKLLFGQAFLASYREMELSAEMFFKTAFWYLVTLL